MTASRAAVLTDRFISDWLEYVAVDDAMSYVESRLIELSQRDLTIEESDRLAGILQRAERGLLAGCHRMRRRAA